MKHLWLRSKGDKWVHSPKDKRDECELINVEGEKRCDNNKIQELVFC
jgi:hypothetical protein